MRPFTGCCMKQQSPLVQVAAEFPKLYTTKRLATVQNLLLWYGRSLFFHDDKGSRLHVRKHADKKDGKLLG